MSVPGPTEASRPRRSVFLSYASDDRPAVKVLRDALLEFGLEVLYDESSLDGGDAWDRKIRRQIRECDFFMPVISAQTEARPEGYFRREWRLAVERTLDMADDHIFLLPVVIDGTSDAQARVPEKFFAVQWLKLPGGQPTPALEALCRRLVSGQAVEGLQPGKKGSGEGAGSGQGPDLRQRQSLGQRADQAESPDRPSRKRSRLPPPVREYPPFPKEEPGQKTRFWFQALGWTFEWIWISFNRLPNWVRICAYVWIGIFLLAQLNSHDSGHISPSDTAKLKEITDKYQGSADKADIVKLGAEIAREFSDDSDEQGPATNPLLAIPFSAPAGDAAAAKLANVAFAQVYGRIAISNHGHVGLTTDVPSSPDLSVAVREGRAHHANYVLYGALDRQSNAENLTVSLVSVSDESLLWSKSYPVASADPAVIAAEVDSTLSKAQGD
jgi:TolB-like protein